MRFHVEARAADLSGAASRRAKPRGARASEFGSMEKHKEESRASFGLRLLDEARGDTRYALRTFARNKTFAATAIVTLALGIGANTAIFSLLDALMLRSLPVPNPQALVQVGFRVRHAGQRLRQLLVRDRPGLGRRTADLQRCRGLQRRFTISSRRPGIDEPRAGARS